MHTGEQCLNLDPLMSTVPGSLLFGHKKKPFREAVSSPSPSLCLSFVSAANSPCDSPCLKDKCYTGQYEVTAWPVVYWMEHQPVF